MNEKLLANIRFYFAQAVFMNSCHFNAMDRLKQRENKISLLIKIVSGATIISLVLQIIGFENNVRVVLKVAVFIGLLATTISLIFNFFYKDDRIFEIYRHRVYAEKYKFLRDEYMSLITDIMANSIPEDQQRINRNDFQNRYSIIGESAPTIDVIDYENARKNLGIQKNDKEEFTWSDFEIDKFLPKQLRIS